MQPELAGDGAIPEENLGAGSTGSRSRRFLNGLSIFQSKRFASSISSTAEHRRGASLDSSAACLGGGSFRWQCNYRDALVCEQPLESTQCRQPSVRPNDGPIQRTVGPLAIDVGGESDAVDNDQQQCKRRQTTRSTIVSHCDARSGSKDKDQSSRKASLWLRIVGRFAGKNRVREESSSQAKDHVLDVQKKAGANSHLREHKPLKKAVEASRSSRSAARSQPPEEARKGTKKYKWVSCEDVGRVSSRKDQSRSHYELVKPVLEPVQFATADLSHCPEKVIHAPRKTSQPATPPLGDNAGGLEDSETRKRLLFVPSRAISDDQHTRMIEECKNVVTHLRCKKGKEQGVVAAEARLLAKDYPVARATLATLGAIAPLVAMLDSTSTFCAHTALLALYTLAIGNDHNKAAVVDAGAIPKMLDLLQKSEPSMREAVVANFLSLSALDRNKPLIGSSGAIFQLVQTLRLGGEQIGRESLRALYNLSLAQSNIKLFVEADATTVVMEILKTRDVYASSTTAEKSLAVVGNMVATPVGRKSVTDVPEGLEILIGVLGWGVQFSKCQERAAYILMVIAHHSYGHRQAMVEKRAIPALLEVSLLGSALAQKRAVKVLECLREDREQGRPMSAPMEPPRKARHSDSIPKLEHKAEIGEGSKIVNDMVQQSLEKNLQRIVRRANLPASMDHTRASSLSGCSSSKSLPF
ncbi:hypothetical protein M758_10G042700 [Ceratodon purpureus]|nr:hypothetical protein M758_10G042700 [Ceratodon purpureus]